MGELIRTTTRSRKKFCGKIPCQETGRFRRSQDGCQQTNSPEASPRLNTSIEKTTSKERIDCRFTSDEGHSSNQNS
jgi:hypothetical protein